MSEERVRVDVVRSGGFAGLTKRGSANTDDLDDQSSTELRRLLDESGLESDGPSSPPPAAGGADRFQYDVSISRDGQEQRVTRREPDLTPAQQRLISWVLGSR